MVNVITMNAWLVKVQKLDDHLDTLHSMFIVDKVTLLEFQLVVETQ
jgi:hypothetical protein